MKKIMLKNRISGEIIEYYSYFEGLFKSLIKNYPTSRVILESEGYNEEDFDKNFDKHKILKDFVKSWYYDDTAFEAVYENGDEINAEDFDTASIDSFEKEYFKKALKYYNLNI